mmetsp:Transcript_44652/g.104288  ORF Transcript_44652/g.104288 Transcript_44652/m.104288 type:complete len:337 (-) Transcript_44652:78-1088(-)
MGVRIGIVARRLAREAGARVGSCADGLGEDLGLREGLRQTDEEAKDCVLLDDLQQARVQLVSVQTQLLARQQLRRQASAPAHAPMPGRALDTTGTRHGSAPTSLPPYVFAEISPPSAGALPRLVLTNPGHDQDLIATCSLVGSLGSAPLAAAEIDVHADTMVHEDVHGKGPKSTSCPGHDQLPPTPATEPPTRNELLNTTREARCAHETRCGAVHDGSREWEACESTTAFAMHRSKDAKSSAHESAFTAVLASDRSVGERGAKRMVALAVNPGGAAAAPIGSSGRFSWEPLLSHHPGECYDPGEGSNQIGRAFSTNCTGNICASNLANGAHADSHF